LGNGDFFGLFGQGAKTQSREQWQDEVRIWGGWKDYKGQITEEERGGTTVGLNLAKMGVKQ